MWMVWSGRYRFDARFCAKLSNSLSISRARSGGISIALALSLTDDISEKSLIIAITYIVVAFSILVQGLTAKKVVDKILA